ncbi:hypothetical protein [Trichothermofontia sp.]
MSRVFVTGKATPVSTNGQSRDRQPDLGQAEPLEDIWKVQKQVALATKVATTNAKQRLG